MEQTVQFDPHISTLDLFGPADSHLRYLKQTFGVRLSARQSDLRVIGPEESVAAVVCTVEALQDHLRVHGALTLPEVQRLASTNPSHSPLQRDTGVEVYTRHKQIKPSTEGQRQYLKAMMENDVTFCMGPAGTGKTYLAVAVAVSMLKRREIRRIILARPAVEAGEKLGFLPGDLQAKVNPYLRPLFDALEDMMDFKQMKKLMELDIIEVSPLAFMRGRTLNEAVVICDEAQNTSGQQMLMVLTRLGHGSKMIITGDVTQVDLESHQTSGMVEAMRILKQIEGIGIVELDRGDIVRHRLVQSIVHAYKNVQDRRLLHVNSDPSKG